MQSGQVICSVYDQHPFPSSMPVPSLFSQLASELSRNHSPSARINPHIHLSLSNISHAWAVKPQATGAKRATALYTVYWPSGVPSFEELLSTKAVPQSKLARLHLAPAHNEWCLPDWLGSGIFSHALVPSDAPVAP